MTRSESPFYQGTNSGETYTLNSPDDLNILLSTGFKLPNSSRELQTYFNVTFEWSKDPEWHQALLRLFHTQQHLVLLEIFSHIREHHGGYTDHQCQFIDKFLSQVAAKRPEALEVRMASAVIGSCTPEVALCLFYITAPDFQQGPISAGPKAQALIKCTRSAHQIMTFRSKYGPPEKFIRSLNLPYYNKDTQTFTL